MDKIKLFELIQAEHAFLDRTLALLSDAQMTQADVQGGWTVKDILAHITTWEQRCLGWLEAAERGEKPQRPEPGYTWDELDALNEQDRQASKDRPLDEVLSAYRRSYAEILARVAELPREALFDPDYYAWREGQPLWLMIAGNTHWHYEEHTATIREWLAKQPS